MKKGLRWIFCIGVALSAFYGLLVLYSDVMEPTHAEESTREFLEARSLTLEQFSGPEFHPPSGRGFNRYVWTRQDGDQVLKVDTTGHGQLICLYYTSPSTGDISRSICRDSTKRETLVTDCVVLQLRPRLIDRCEPLSR